MGDRELGEKNEVSKVNSERGVTKKLHLMSVESILVRHKLHEVALLK